MAPETAEIGTSEPASSAGEAQFSGLTAAQVEASRREHGSNKLTPPKRDPWWKLLLEKFDDPVIRILMIAAVLAIVVGAYRGEYYEGVAIIVAILLATGIAFLNEYKASREFDILNQVNDEVPINAVRDGRYTTVPLQELVVGDVVLIEAGEEVPADGRLLEAVSLTINESGLTGESEPHSKVTQQQLKTHQPEAPTTYPADVVLRGCPVVEGHGVLEVTAVGDKTQIGQTARSATELTGVDTPLNRQLDKLSKVIGVVGLGVAGMLFAVLVVTGAASGLLVLSAGQWAAAAVLGVGVMVALALVWLPMVYDGLELIGDLFGRSVSRPAWLGGEEDSPEKPEDQSSTWQGLWPWILSVGGGLAIVLVGMLVLILAGLVDWSPGSWLPLTAVELLLGYFMIAVTIIVVAVPEGLAMSVTLSLAYSMRKMTASNTLVRKMHACETVGAVTVICSDKTGTLTRNQMRLYASVFPALGQDGSEDGPGGLRGEGLLQSSRAANRIVEAIAVNSTANLSREQSDSSRAPSQSSGSRQPARQTVEDKASQQVASGQTATPERQVIGNPTEGALLYWLQDHKIDYLRIRLRFPVKKQLTFSTERKYMATLGKSPATDQTTLHVKGAPEVILHRCIAILTPDGVEELDDARRNDIHNALLDYQARGMRTLGFAYREDLPELADNPDLQPLAQERLVWLGFVAISDPIREDVPAAIDACRTAGIQVKMVTGDTSSTSKEIARQLRLWTDEDEASGSESGMHLSGQQFGELSDGDAGPAAERLKILSRARPMEKVKLVRSLQAEGEVVAVTGDGVNDTGALNYADVGLSMGMTGKAAAKEASDIVLLDDSFSTIVKAVVWGRSLYQNIQRFILFQLTINVAALAIAFLGPFIDVQLPLTVIQMLWVNLIMDTFAALALATEPPSEEVMTHKPRDPDAFIVTPAMAKGIFGVGAVFVAALLALLLFLQPTAVEEASWELTVFFNIFVLLQFWNLFNARRLGVNKSALTDFLTNPSFLTIAVAIFVGQVLIVQFGGDVFRTVPLTFLEWLAMVAGTSVVLWAGEIWRLLNRRQAEEEAAMQVAAT